MQILHTPRLTLRWFDEADAAFVKKLLNEPSWIRHIGPRGVHTWRYARRWIASRLVASYGRQGFGFWAVERRADQAVIGMCGLIQRETLPEVDLGYALLPRFWGQGFAREAAAACLRYGHEVLGLRTIWGITGPDNVASGRVLLAIGMHEAGLRRLPGDTADTRVHVWQAPPSPQDDDDQAQIDALAARLVGAFDNHGEAPPTLPALPHHFLPGAVIHHAVAARPAQTLNLHGFIAPRAALLHGGRLRQHHGWQLDHRTDLHGPFAQRWMRCASRGRLDDRDVQTSSSSVMQLVRQPRGWKIAALAWHDDDEAVAAPPPG